MCMCAVPLSCGAHSDRSKSIAHTHTHIYRKSYICIAATEMIAVVVVFHSFACLPARSSLSSLFIYALLYEWLRLVRSEGVVWVCMCVYHNTVIAFSAKEER